MMTLGTLRFVQMECAGLVSASSAAWLCAVGEIPIAPSLPARRLELHSLVLLVGLLYGSLLSLHLDLPLESTEPTCERSSQEG